MHVKMQNNKITLRFYRNLETIFSISRMMKANQFISRVYFAKCNILIESSLFLRFNIKSSIYFWQINSPPLSDYILFFAIYVFIPHSLQVGALGAKIIFLSIQLVCIFRPENVSLLAYPQYVAHINLIFCFSERIQHEYVRKYWIQND